MSERQERVFGGVPAWLLEEYLVELGGQKRDEGSIEGPGWTATATTAPRPGGGVGIGRVTVTIEGREAERVMEELRRRALRGGG